MATFDTVWYISSVGYTAVTAWAATTTKHCGDMVRQLAAPTVNNERTFVCIASTSGTGQTGGSEPTWVITRGAKTTDSTVTWMEATGIAALNGDLTNTPTWANTNIKNHAISLGQVIQNVAGTLLLICTTAGTTGNGSEPSWAAATNAGATTADNTATWTTLGAPSNYAAWSHPHARMNAAVSSAAAGWGVAGNTFYFADNHAETQTSSNSITGLTGIPPAMSPCLSIDHTLSLPPTASSLKTGASVATTTGSNLQIAFGANIACMYFYGFTFNAASGFLTLGNQCHCNIRADSCTFIVSTGSIQFGGGGGNAAKIKLNNCVMSFGDIGCVILEECAEFEWTNTASAIIGGAVPTILFNTSLFGHCTIRGVDLSALGSGKTLFNITSAQATGTISDCKISSAVTLVAGPTLPGAGLLDFVRCDSAATDYAFSRVRYEGTLSNENTIVRTGGASDGTTGVAFKVVTSANVAPALPLDCLPITVWNSTTGSNVTVTLHGITTLASLPNNNDIWAEVQYLGSASSPLASFASNFPATLLTAASALSADTSSAWGAGASAYATTHAYGAFTGVILAGNASPQQLWFMASHAGTGTSGSSSTIFNGQSDGAQVTDNAGGNQIIWQAMTRFSMAVTLSSPQPQLAGYMYAYVKVAKASSTFYIDPKLS